MVRTQVQLAEDNYQRLRQVAARQRRSVADCVREGVTLFLRKSEEQPGSLEEIAGKFPPLATAGLKEHDAWWAEAALDSRKVPGG